MSIDQSSGVLYKTTMQRTKKSLPALQYLSLDSILLFDFSLLIFLLYYFCTTTHSFSLLCRLLLTMLLFSNNTTTTRRFCFSTMYGGRMTLWRDLICRDVSSINRWWIAWLVCQSQRVWKRGWSIKYTLAITITTKQSTSELKDGEVSLRVLQQNYNYGTCEWPTSNSW